MARYAGRAPRVGGGWDAARRTRPQARVHEGRVPGREGVRRAPVVEVDPADARADAREVEHVARRACRVPDAVVAGLQPAPVVDAHPDDAARLGEPDLAADESQ